MTAAGLDVDRLTVRFGGNTAVDDVSFVAPLGRVTGLIGPNGAGKTSTFNACSGLLRPADGRIRFRGHDITRLPIHRRCQLGLGRTFQRMELFESLSVRENVSLGREAMLAGSRLQAHVWGGRAARQEVRAATDDAIELCRLGDLAARPVASLSTGQRRFVELARSTAGGASLILLDEPSSGLDPAETARLGDTLLSIVETRCAGLLLVEHDMGLVMRVCDHLYVLDFGRLLFAGTPQEVQASPVVRQAYMGTAA